MKILLAIDDSKFSVAALEFVLSQNRPGETEIRVLHVLEPIAPDLPLVTAEGHLAEWDRFRQEQTRQAIE